MNCVSVLSPAESFESDSRSSVFAESLTSWWQKSAEVLSNSDIDKVFKTERKVEPFTEANKLT